MIAVATSGFSRSITLAKCYLDKEDKAAAKDAVIIAVEKNPESFDANFSA